MSTLPCRLAISTMSLGRAWHHQLGPKLTAAATQGFSGIELFYEDLEYHAKEFFHGSEPAHLLQAASHVRQMCAQLNLEIVCLQPLMHFEGLIDPSVRAAAFQKARLWLRLANALRTPIIAVPSSFLKANETTGDMATVVRDLQELADLAAASHIRLVHEALAWGTHCDRWEQSWDIVQAVDRPNFGICLDTFNIAGRVFADPTSADGMTSNATSDLEQSLQHMAAVVDPAKVFYIQVVDAERLTTPLTVSHEFYDADQPARMSWSRNCRLFYGEQDRGAYLPIRRIMESIMQQVGFSGWISMELFNRSMADPSPLVPIEHAERGANAWRKLQEDFGFVDEAHQSLPQVKGLNADLDEKARPRSVL